MRTITRFAGRTLAALLVLATAGYLWASWITERALARRYATIDAGISDAVRTAPVELGRRIVTVRNGCVDCHGRDLGGGLIAENPFIGSLHGPNLTPAALRDWRDDDIARALRWGVGRDGRPLVIMPSHEYRHLGREDIAAIVAYLRSVPPVERRVPAIDVGPGARVLYALGKLPLLAAETIAQEPGFADKPVEAPTAEFGRYLATSACSGCHGTEFRGGPIAGAPPDWATPTSLRLGADSRWTEPRFRETLRSGRSALDGHALRAPMPVSLVSQFGEVEIGALWRFLSGLR